MLRIAPFRDDAKHVVPLEVDGRIGFQDFANVVSTIEQRLQRHDRLRLHLEIYSLGGISAETLFTEFTDAIRHWNRFDKLAIVTDIGGVERVASVVDALAPGIACKAFTFAQRESARQWAIA